MSIVVENVRRILSERGLKQGIVASSAGYTYQSFNNLMNGRKIITDTDICRLAVALNVSPNELFGIESSKSESA